MNVSRSETTFACFPAKRMISISPWQFCASCGCMIFIAHFDPSTDDTAS
tara:strand:- start:215 stop:361 length:147 start_codon:yes stop_codon:yes gene_type:complete